MRRRGPLRGATSRASGGFPMGGSIRPMYPIFGFEQGVLFFWFASTSNVVILEICDRQRIPAPPPLEVAVPDF